MSRYEPIRRKLKDHTVHIDKDALWKSTSHAIPRRHSRRRLILLVCLAGVVITGAGIYSLQEGFFISPTQQAADGRSAPDQAPKTSPAIVPHLSPPAPGSGATQPPDIHTPSPVTEMNDIETGSIHLPVASINVMDPVHDRMNASSRNFMIAASPLQDSSPAGDMTPDSGSRKVRMRQLGALTPLPVLPILSLSDEGNINRLSVPLATQIKPAKTPGSISIRMLPSIGWSVLNIEAHDPDWNDLATQLNASTRSLECKTFSLHGVYKLQSGISFSVGLQWSGLTTALTHLHTRRERIETQGVREIVIDENGDQTLIPGAQAATKAQGVQSTRYTFHNRLDLEGSINLPLLRFSRIACHAWGKAGLNIRYRSAGSTINHEGDLIRYDASDDVFHLRNPFLFGAGLQASWRMSPRASLVVRTAYEPFVYSHALWDHHIQSRHALFHLGVGIDYQLN